MSDPPSPAWLAVALAATALALSGPAQAHDRKSIGPLRLAIGFGWLRAGYRWVALACGLVAFG